jgi:hypothetical protein
MQIFAGAGLETYQTRPVGVRRRDFFAAAILWTIPPDFFWPLGAAGDFISGENAILL